MNTVSKFKALGVMLKTAFLLMLLMSLASGSQTPGGDGNLTNNQHWNLLTNEGGANVQESASSENDVEDINTISTATVVFDFQNQSAPAGAGKVVIGNDTAKIIKLEATDINNDLLNYAIVRSPSHGKISGTAPNVVYVPDRGYLGNDTIVFSAHDQIGNLENITISIDVVKLYNPPSVRILSPFDGDIFTAFEDTLSAQIPLRAIASDSPDTITISDLFEGYETEIGTESCSYTDSSCSGSDDKCRVTMFGDFSAGRHFLIARASYSSGRIVNSSPITIIVNPPEPIPMVATPLNGEILTAPADITITAKVDVITEGNSIDNVEYFENSHRLGSAIENVSPYTFVWEGVTPGVYNIQARATDDNGNTAISPSILVIVVPAKPLSKSDLAITMKSSSDPAPAGGLLNYVLTLTNRGPDSATDVVVQDYLPPELTFISFKASQGSYDSGIWNVGGLTKYRSAKLVLTVQAPSEDVPGQIANTAYVYGAELDPDNSNNHVTAYTRIRSASNSSPE
jgi:uncharacterized repeat protein (TIGR01451 family)